MACLDFMQTLLILTSKSLNFIPFLLYNFGFFNVLFFFKNNQTQNNMLKIHFPYLHTNLFEVISNKNLNSMINNKMAYSSYIDECENELAYGILTYNELLTRYMIID